MKKRNTQGAHWKGEPRYVRIEERILVQDEQSGQLVPLQQHKSISEAKRWSLRKQKELGGVGCGSLVVRHPDRNPRSGQVQVATRAFNDEQRQVQERRKLRQYLDPVELRRRQIRSYLAPDLGDSSLSSRKRSGRRPNSLRPAMT